MPRSGCAGGGPAQGGGGGRRAQWLADGRPAGGWFLRARRPRLARGEVGRGVELDLVGHDAGARGLVGGPHEGGPPGLRWTG